MVRQNVLSFSTELLLEVYCDKNTGQSFQSKKQSSLRNYRNAYERFEKIKCFCKKFGSKHH